MATRAASIRSTQRPTDILGLKAYPSVLLDFPDPVDLAVILVPNKAVPAVMEQCGQHGVKGAVVITAGFREVGPQAGAQQQVVDICRRYGMRMVGPNVLGIIDTVLKLNASVAAGMPVRGRIAFMSQSGALCTSIFDLAMGQGIGFSRFYSIGNKADINELDLVKAWAEDPETRAIMAYLEGISNGPEFIRIASEVTRHKPIIAIKSGTTSAGSKAVSSHTGTLAGFEAAYDAAFKQCGIIRAGSVQDLFDYAQRSPASPCWKAMASHRCHQCWRPRHHGLRRHRAGWPQAGCADKRDQVGASGPAAAAASVANPIDVLGDAPAARYALGIEAALKDPNVNAVLLVLTPQTSTQIPETAEVLGKLSKQYGKPVFGAMIGDAAIREGVKVLRSYDVPNYQVPERAVAAIASMWQHRQWLHTPPLAVEPIEVDRRESGRVVRQGARRRPGDNRRCGSARRARGLRRPAAQGRSAATADEAVTLAESIGYPVVMKIASPDILHKSDIGGIKLNITSASEVRDAFDLLTYRGRRYMPDATLWGCQVQQMVKGGREVIIGVNRDPQLRPADHVRSGRHLRGGVEGRDVPRGVHRPPQRHRDAERNPLFKLLRRVRGEKPSDQAAIVDTLLRVSQLVTDFPEIVELDINPLMVFEQGRGVLGIDMRLAFKVSSSQR